MCGIAGIFHYGDEEPVAMESVRAMTQVIVHRGPDADGFHLDGALGIGVRRLRIIDLETGDQPIGNEDDTVWTVFNGEIYNFAELRADLESRGHVFRTQSDTEVIVHQYEEDGPACVERFRGMFAIAVWDAAARELVLMRDRFGVKPLFVAHSAGRMAFASEMKELLTLDWTDREWRPEALRAYLALGFIPAPLTVYQGVRKVTPGTVEVWRQRGERTMGMVARRRYWEPKVAPAPFAGGYDEAKERVVGLLREAVRLRLRSDVPLGAFLSGGVDSSAVVAFMRDLGVDDLKTFSIGFEQAAFNELPYADRVAAHLGTDHHRLVVTAADAACLPKILGRFDEPYGDSSAIPTYYVSRLAREHVTVALSGDGGDEIFGGYDHYRRLRYYRALDVLPLPMRRGVGALAGRVLSEKRRGGGFARKLGADHGQRLLTMLYRPSGGVVWDALGREFVDFLDSAGDGGWQRLFACDSSVADAQAVDQRTYLCDDIMTKVDRSSMAVSLEAREPLLDHKLAEFVNRLPAGHKIRDGKGKALLRDVAAAFVPRDVFDRPKHGFAVPLRSWLTGPLDEMTSSILGDAPRGLLDGAGVRTLLETLRHGESDLSDRAWTLLSLSVWASRGGVRVPW